MAAYYETPQEYAGRIRNTLKRAYAFTIIARAKTEGYEDAMENAPVPDGLSYMGAQAVRMQIAMLVKR
jgi:hypothetical protein